jgi:nucleoside-diphosphate-sugar epimerase
MKTIIVTGGTGYIGSRLLQKLRTFNYRIIAIIRPGSLHKLPDGIEPIIADVFNPAEWISQIPEHAIFIHLLGVPHPAPSKKKLFESIDLRSAQIVSLAASQTRALKFIFLSVAMEPSSIMRDFQEAKWRSEQYIKSLHLPYVFVRPWYVLGPGHWWPYLLWPLFKLLEVLPSTRKKAKAFGFVTIKQMIQSLVYIVNHINEMPDVMEVEDIRRVGEGENRRKGDC